MKLTHYKDGSASAGSPRSFAAAAPVAALVGVMALVGAMGTARADVFEIKDQESFEKCLATDHLLETVNTAKGTQSKVLDPIEIQMRCIAGGVKLVAAKKDKALALEFVETAKRMTAHVNALDLVSALVDISLPACNELAGYTVVTRALSFPSDSGTLYPRAKSIVKRCLKDKDYKKDFLEEIDSSDALVAANSCQILLGEKLVKSCKKASK